ncbi:alpha/beta hydrolase [Dyella choica]|uniref:Alpha/beta fold hydrolase n=1 Tax=Dyella choica TaxID=1927959 RepID=A0A432M310_9GAMM|nr:alpha/beta fold hydrolase [Dyella choica]RUL72911.1 alpha/beta fold hydrolase [Dyella choica]
MNTQTLAVLVGLVCLFLAVPGRTEPTAACRAHGQVALAAWTQGDNLHVVRDFAPDTAAQLTPGTLKEVWAQLQAKAGAFRKLDDLQPRTIDGHALLVANLEFANASLAALIGCDGLDRITTFRIVPMSALSEAAAQASMPAPGAGMERTVQIASPLGPLPGTLLLPKGKGPFPVALLLAGSGPVDRDETVGPNKPFRDLAEGLAAAGIGSLRYDKRTHVYGKQAVTDAFSVDDEVTDDALAALQLLAQQPSVDPHRLFVLGHSLGALIGPRIGQRDAKLAGLILLAAPAKLGPDVLIRQIRYLAPRQGATQAQLDGMLAPLMAAREMLAQADPKHPPAGEFFHAPASYWLSLRDYDPIVTAKSLSMPMLILQGGGDYQVTPQDDFSHWQAAFAQDPRVKLVEYPGLSHLFMPAGQPPSAADYTKPSHFDARVLQDVTAWIKARPAPG